MTIAESQRFGYHAVFVCSSGSRTSFEKNAHNLEVSVGCGKVERCRSFSTGSAAGAFGFETRRIDVGAMEDEHAHALLAAAGAGGMQGQDAIEFAIGRLAILESKLDEADVACSGSIVQTEVGMHSFCMAGGAAEAALTDGLEGGTTNSAAQHSDGEETMVSDGLLSAGESAQARVDLQVARCGSVVSDQLLQCQV